MSELLNKLRNSKCDIKGAMERFLNDEELYEECYSEALNDEAFSNLGRQLRENDLEGAFDSAHTLKGVLSNMGLNPLYDIVVKLVEPLRVKKSEGLLSVYDELMAMRDSFLKFK